MSLTSVIAGLKESGFTCLVVDGKKIHGIRGKLFDEPTRQFVYFDFDVSLLNDENKKYIKDNMKNLPKEKLIDKGDMWLTQSEIDGGVVVTEYESAEDVNKQVARIIKVITLTADL